MPKIPMVPHAPPPPIFAIDDGVAISFAVETVATATAGAVAVVVVVASVMVAEEEKHKADVAGALSSAIVLILSALF